MIPLLLRALGISSQLTSQLQEVRWLWARPVWLAVGLLLLAPTGWLIIRRQRVNLPFVSPAMRAALSGCRIGVLFLLVVVLGGPYLRLEERVEQKPILALLIDDSGSMGLPAGPFEPQEQRSYAIAAGLTEVDKATRQPPPLSETLRNRLEGMSRSELLDAALLKHKAMIEQLGRTYEVIEYRVARHVRKVDAGKVAGPPDATEASESALGAAVEEAVNDAGGRPMAGIVLVTDGRWTTGPSPMAAVRRLSGSTREGGIGPPVFTIPVGSRRALADIALLDVFAPAELSKDDTAAVTATLASTAYDGQETEVILREGDKVLDRQRVKLTADRRQQVQLSFKASEAGPKVLTVAALPRPDERIKDNNEQAVAINVETEKLKVLYLEGSPRWDFRFLDHALRRDKGLDARIVMESQLAAGGIKPPELPVVAQVPVDAKSFSQYHVVMLGDISPAMLPPALQAELVKAVDEHGLGVIVEAGTQEMPRSFLGQPLASLLPFRIASQSPQDSGMEAPAFKPYRMHVTPAGATHPAFAIYSDPSRNRQVWSSMPAFFWAARASEVRAGATLLAEVETELGRRPLIAEQFVGRGRVLTLGTDSTFWWRRNVGDALFYRFWGQAIRHVARKRVREGNQSWIEAQPRNAEPGSPVTLELYAVNPSGQPLNDKSVSVVVGDARDTRTLLLQPTQQAGHYQGRWTGEGTGLFNFTYTDRGGVGVSAAVRLAESGRERLYPTVDRDTLGSLADATGGRLLELTQLENLPALLHAEPRIVERIHEEEIWDNWLTLVLLVTLYCTDVGIRRLLGLT